MKKNKFIFGVVAAISLLVAMTSCDLSIRDPYKAPPVSKVTVGLGGENTLNVSKVDINGTVDASLADPALKPSGWNAVSEFIQAEIAEGEYVEYTFTQPTQGADAWVSWALAIFDENNFGNFLRGDNWLNLSADAGFAGGKWCAGGSSGNGVWDNGYAFDTCASKLPVDAVVVIRVEFDGTDVSITEKVNDVVAYTTTSKNW